MKKLLLQLVKNTIINELHRMFKRNLTPAEQAQMYTIATRIDNNEQPGIGKTIIQGLKEALQN